MNQKLEREEFLLPYRGKSSNNGIFSFTTDFGVNYSVVIFKVETFSEYYFGNNVFDIAINCDLQNPPKDKRVQITINELIASFLLENEHYILTFVCDFADNKHLARKRKFNNWFKLANNDDFVMHFLEYQIVDIYYIFGIIYNTNTYGKELLSEIELNISKTIESIKSEK